MPSTAEIIISKMGDTFFFKTGLVPNIIVLSNVSEFSNNWYEYVEFGTTNPLTILLQRNGFSREAATYIRGHQEYVSADKSAGQLRLNRSLLQCGNTSVEMEAADIILNVPELFV